MKGLNVLEKVLVLMVQDLIQNVDKKKCGKPQSWFSIMKYSSIMDVNLFIIMHNFF